MDASLPVALPVHYESRRGWLIAFGVIEILMGCAFLLMLLSMAIYFLEPTAGGMPPGASSAGPFSQRSILVLALLEYGLAAVVFISGGIGSIQCRNWARVMMLVVSGLWLAVGIIFTFIMAFIFPITLRLQPGDVDPGVQHAIIAGAIAVAVVLGVALPAVFLFFYSRPSVKATCLSPKGAPVAMPVGAAPGFPVPLAILLVWEALSAFAVFAMLIIPAAIMFGFVVRGFAVGLVFLAHSILSGYAAWTIYRRKILGWYISLFKAAFWTISMMVTYALHPDLLPLYQQMDLNAHTLNLYEQAPQLLKITWVGMIGVVTLLLVFVLYARRFFPAEERA